VINLESGSNGYVSGFASLAVKKDNFRTRLSSNIRHSDGYRHNTDFDNLNLFVNSTYENSRGIYRLNVGYRKKEFGA